MPTNLLQRETEPSKSVDSSTTVWDMVLTPKKATKGLHVIKPTLKEQGFDALLSGSQSGREYERQHRIQYTEILTLRLE